MNPMLLQAVMLAAAAGPLTPSRALSREVPPDPLDVPPTPEAAPPPADAPPGPPPRARRVCSIVDCERRGTHLAGILLRRGDEDRGRVAWLGLLLCPACRRRLQVRDVLTDAGWKKLEELGRATAFIPRRELCRIQTVELEQAPARFRDRYEE